MLTSAAIAPPIPTAPEEMAAALDQVGPLHGLPLEDRLWLVTHGKEYVVNAGDILFEEGAPARALKLIETEQSSTGVITSHYLPVGPVKPGSFGMQPSKAELARRRRLAAEKA